MLWTDQLQPASFRGVPFHVDSVEVSGGDNIVVREYPFGDLPTTFRMGAAAEEIRFSAYVIGDDYIAQRNALIKALEGDGVLVHPTSGAIRVAVGGKYTYKEAPTTEGGIVRFQLSFVRAEARRYPQAAPSGPATAAAAADAVKASAADRFAAGFDWRSAPGWVQSRVVDRVNSVLDTAWAGIKVATADLGDFTDGVIGSYQVLRSGLSSTMGTPRALAGAVGELFTLPTDLSDASSRAFQSAFEGLFDLESKVPNRAFEVAVVPPVGEGLVLLGAGDGDALASDTLAQQQLRRLQDQVDQLVESLATAAWVQAVTARDLAGYDEAMSLRATAYKQCTGLLARVSSAAPAATLPASSLYDGLVALLTSVQADLQERSRELARLTQFTPRTAMSIWSISYRLYGTADYAEEIAAMNPHIQHPMLVPPGRPLRVVRH